MKSSTLKTHENCEESVSSTRRTRNSKKPSRTRVRSWNHESLLLCRVKIMKKNCGSSGSNKVKKQNLRVFWKLMNLRDCVWEIQYQIIMKTILQEKETIHYSTTIWFTNLILCLKLWKFLQHKQRWTRNGKNWRKFRRGTWQKLEVKKSWSMKQGRRASQVHCASQMDISHLKNAELEAKHQKYKGRVVLRGDIVKDDAGSYALFTEQGSSASQMTAAKIMDISSRLPGCDGHAELLKELHYKVSVRNGMRLGKTFFSAGTR